MVEVSKEDQGPALVFLRKFIMLSHLTRGSMRGGEHHGHDWTINETQSEFYF